MIWFVFQLLFEVGRQLVNIKDKSLLMINAMITIPCHYFKKYSVLLSREEINKVLNKGSYFYLLIALENKNKKKFTASIKRITYIALRPTPD